MEKQTRRAQRTAVKPERTDHSVLDVFLKLRYLIGLLVIVVIVTFNLNGSSLGVWDKYVSQRDDGKKTDVIFGQNRKFVQMNGSCKHLFIFHKLKMTIL